jgi:hypothetical protein
VDQGSRRRRQLNARWWAAGNTSVNVG